MFHRRKGLDRGPPDHRVVNGQSVFAALAVAATSNTGSASRSSVSSRSCDPPYRHHHQAAPHRPTPPRTDAIAIAILDEIPDPAGHGTVPMTAVRPSTSRAGAVCWALHCCPVRGSTRTRFAGCPAAPRVVAVRYRVRPVGRRQRRRGEQGCSSNHVMTSRSSSGWRSPVRHWQGRGRVLRPAAGTG